MTCGVILEFDPQADAAVRSLWQAIASAGLPATMLERDFTPHVTLLASGSIDFTSLNTVLPGFLSGSLPLEVDFPGLGIFTAEEPVVYLALTRTPALSSLHAAFWELARRFVFDPVPYYLPEQWVPHVTLSLVTPPYQPGAVIDLLVAQPRLTRGTLINLKIVDFDGGKRCLFSAPLGKNPQ